MPLNFRFTFGLVFLSLCISAQNQFNWAQSISSTTFDDIGVNMLKSVNGSLYSVGNLRGTVDLDPGPGVFTLSSAGGYDFFINKFDSSIL